MNRLLLGTVVGLLLAALMGASIFFVPQEPLKTQIFFATSIKGALIGLMLAALLHRSDRWLKTLVVGLVIGALWGLVIALAKGFQNAPYVLPDSAVHGLLLAAILKKWGYEPTF